MKERLTRIRITAVTPEGYGIGRDEDGKVVFVPDTAPGDLVAAGIIKELKNSSVARLEEIIAPSPMRVIPDCRVCRKCGGCVFRHISYDAETEIKRGFVREAFARIGGMDIEAGETRRGSELYYRNKVQYPFARGEDGKCVFGYYARRSHRVVRHDVCLLQDQSFYETARYCAGRADELGIPAYDEQTASGVLRHIVMRRSRAGEMLVCLVTNENSAALRRLAEDIFNRFPFIAGVHINLNARRDNVIFGEETFRAAGDEALYDTLCGKKFALSPRSFYQVNAEMAERLYSHAAKLAAGAGGRVILDLYCGVGAVGLCVAGADDKLCGVEIIPEAAEDARANAKLNGRSEENTLFVCGDAACGVRECEKRFGSPDVITVDPPRKGLDTAVIDTIVSAAPEKVIYISCDPATLARDCRIFAEKGYKTDKATPFDLFPRTGHIETVALITRAGL
ncbi:MAG: 23S rRNA (uracil(1939)-C(5))-methyltransferase RlmD [Clostridia bacterium]|nr:23S rRNA (uracil(1939)-C(5))-methyltransferase RlmD [Clostridia bacterium]